MSFKKWWNEEKGWKKGIIIAFGFYLLFIAFTLEGNPSMINIFGFTDVILDKFPYITDNIFHFGFGEGWYDIVMVVLFLSLIFYLAVGATLGASYDYFFKRKKNNKK